MQKKHSYFTFYMPWHQQHTSRRVWPLSFLLHTRIHYVLYVRLHKTSLLTTELQTDGVPTTMVCQITSVANWMIVEYLNLEYLNH